MTFSIIFICSERTEDNRVTADCLIRECKALTEKPQVLVYGHESKEAAWLTGLKECTDVEYLSINKCSDVEIYKDAMERLRGAYTTALYAGDTWSDGALTLVEKQMEARPQKQIFLMYKQMPEGEKGAFAGFIKGLSNAVINVSKTYTHYPFYFGGTFVKTDTLKAKKWHTKYGIEAEREFFLGLTARARELVFVDQAIYNSSRSQEGDAVFYKEIYNPDWYDKSFREFWLPYLQNWKEKKGAVPVFIQYHLMFSIGARITANLNNLNKHVIPEGQQMDCLQLMREALQYVDDDVLFNAHKVPACRQTDSMLWFYGILKHGEGFHFEKRYYSGSVYYGYGNVILGKVENLNTNVLFMNEENGVLHIDGTVNPILFSMADHVYIHFHGKKYPLQYNERYALTKVFGVSIFKRHSFSVDLPMEGVKDAALFCCAQIGGETVMGNFSYDSHFSRMSGRFAASYWCFGSDRQYMMVKQTGGLLIRAITPKDRRKQERKLSWEMLRRHNKRSLLFLAVRKAYFIMKPIMKRRPIWMYLDKIYKAGDSSEYLYRYASARNKNIRHYYLVDKHATDYARLKKDGYKPLVRGSIKHRLVFLMADMMVISNSTVFAFNNFGMINSSYIRDLVDFHVCCVQHGMSVQKIAVAQNRLRDNTRLYFCASKYEIENLSRPIYGYVGYDALKLTGVPRYDGLVNDDKKQIMISPTWRMQAAVPVRTSEGEQRDYNPLFKESTYYKVFNSLINDPRLIEAAKKYGYRIKYVLHPIVSAQVDDFDKNDYVDVIPAVGDMSYERMFCESSLMVTDFSGIQFDFAYMRKPLVYLHHKDIPQHYEEGTFFYDTMAFGEITHDNDELIDLLCEYMASGCKMKEEYVRRADDFFYYNDRENCKRIYDVMMEYQDKYILKKGKKA